MSELRFPYLGQESLKGGVPSVRIPYVDQEVLKGGEPNLLATYIAQESLKGGEPNVLVPFVSQDSLKGGEPNVRVALVMVEALMEIIPENEMATRVFPGFGNNGAIPEGRSPASTKLPGLTFQITKSPMFRTRVHEATSGKETRNSLMAMPRWDFELNYEFLEDRTGAESSLKTILGFFLGSMGRSGEWLFKDPDDYLVANGEIGVSDGVTVDYYFRREIGEFSEIVGQVDQDNDVNIYFTQTETHTIPISPGPYTVTVDNAVGFVEDLGVVQGATVFTKVDSAPNNNQYSVDEITGVYTFSVGDDGENVDISYRSLVDPADYTIVGTNRLELDTSAPDGTVLSADFQFFFVCRFTEDAQSYEKFADKLWSLQQVEFKSVLK